VSLASEILSGWAPVMRGVELRSGKGGRFEITLDGEEIFSKEALKRLPEKGEIAAKFESRLGPRLRWRDN
jgi:predicted Rdx family selenoprotein